MKLEIEKNFNTGEYEIIDNSLIGFRKIVKGNFIFKKDAENYLKLLTEEKNGINNC